LRLGEFSGIVVIAVRPTATATMLNTSLAQQFQYSYEEFTDHIKAMRTVSQWEYTSRFGQLGPDQTSRANGARVVEYFSDSYADPKEAVHKAEVFLSIYDYIGRHAALFSKTDLLDEEDNHLFSVDPALLRAVHHIFTVHGRPAGVEPKKVLNLARAYKEIHAFG
jgi:hypothetical protein